MNRMLPLGTGPLQPETVSQRSNDAKSAFRPYRDLVERVADGEPTTGFNSVLDLPTLTHADLAVMLRDSPELFVEAMAEFDATGKVVLGFLADDGARTCAERLTESDRTALVGITVIAAIGDYIRPILLRDVQEECNRRLEEECADLRRLVGDRRSDRELAMDDAGVARAFR